MNAIGKNSFLDVHELIEDGANLFAQDKVSKMQFK